MKRFSLILSLILISFNTIKAENTWNAVPFYPTSNTLNDVFFIDSQFGWAVGYSNTIIHTSNGGSDWAVQEVYTEQYDRYLSVWFTDRQNGWVATENGYLLNTRDGGQNWSIIQTHEDGFYDIFFLDNSNGWIAANNTLLSTKDAGQNWEEMDYFNEGHNWKVDQVYFSDLNSGYIKSADTLFRTTDGGKTWSELCHSLGKVSFTTPNLFWSVTTQTETGESLIKIEIHGADIDTTLVPLNDEITGISKRIYFLDEQTGFVAGDENFFRTGDGGKTWEYFYYTAFEIHSFYFITDSIGFAVGKDYGVILYTTDKGKSWIKQNSGTSQLLYDIDFPDNNNGWIAGAYGTIFRTTNSGDDWTEIFPKKLTGNLYNVEFIDEQSGWLAGKHFDGDSIYLFKTNNACLSFDTVYIDTSNSLTDFEIIEIKFFDTNRGLLVGGGSNNGQNKSAFYYTNDGGINWSKSIEEYTVNDIFVLNDSLGWAAGSGILKTTDGGSNWNLIESDIDFIPFSVFFIDKNNGYAVGKNRFNKFSKTSDGGITWEPNDIDFSEYLYLEKVFFNDPGHGWAYGCTMQNDLHYYILYTSDGGKNWEYSYENVVILHDYYLQKNSMVWIVGDFGKILYSDISDIDAVEEDIKPDNKDLPIGLEILPNPVTGNAQIKISPLPGEKALIEIVDTKGRVIETIAPGPSETDEITIHWDTGNYSGGTYFVKLSCGKYSLSRKAVIIK